MTPNVAMPKSKALLTWKDARSTASIRKENSDVNATCPIDSGINVCPRLIRPQQTAAEAEKKLPIGVNISFIFYNY